jgi:tetratricopeptide (TPR) repeat protein
MDLLPADLMRIRELYAQGYYRRAYDAAIAVGPIRQWTSTPARLIGGRLAIQLGAPSLGRQLHLLAFRSTPAFPEAIYYHARYRMERYGPLSTWEFMRQHPDWSDAPPEMHGDWLALTGFISARLRDFDRAERWLNRAESVSPGRPWPCIERSSSYELAERFDDALSAARRSLELQPWFRPGVQSTAHILLRLGRDREALDLLSEANERIESGLVAAQLAALQNDLGHHADARRTLDRYADLSPMMEPETQKWLAARWADTAYFLGETAAAAEHAKAVKDEFYDTFAARLVQESGNGDEETGDRGQETGDRGQGTGDSRRLALLAIGTADIIRRRFLRTFGDGFPSSCVLA